MTHPEDMTQEEWDALTERQKRQHNEDLTEAMEREADDDRWLS
jgi:hypothetical protein